MLRRQSDVRGLLFKNQLPICFCCWTGAALPALVTYEVNEQQVRWDSVEVSPPGGATSCSLRDLVRQMSWPLWALLSAALLTATEAK